jgi:hypothetical protein
VRPHAELQALVRAWPSMWPTCASRPGVRPAGGSARARCGAEGFGCSPGTGRRQVEGWTLDGMPSLMRAGLAQLIWPEGDTPPDDGGAVAAAVAVATGRDGAWPPGRPRGVVPAAVAAAAGGCVLSRGCPALPTCRRRRDAGVDSLQAALDEALCRSRVQRGTPGNPQRSRPTGAALQGSGAGAGGLACGTGVRGRRLPRRRRHRFARRRWCACSTPCSCRHSRWWLVGDSGTVLLAGDPAEPARVALPIANGDRRRLARPGPVRVVAGGGTRVVAARCRRHALDCWYWPWVMPTWRARAARAGAVPGAGAALVAMFLYAQPAAPACHRARAADHGLPLRALRRRATPEPTL